MAPSCNQDIFIHINKKVSPVVILHLRVELCELSADFLSDSRLHEQALCSLPLQQHLQLFQQEHTKTKSCNTDVRLLNTQSQSPAPQTISTDMYLFY